MAGNNINDAVSLTGIKGSSINDFYLNGSLERSASLTTNKLSAERSVSKNITLSTDPFMFKYSVQKSFGLQTDNFSFYRTVERDFGIKLDLNREDILERVNRGIENAQGVLEQFRETWTGRLNSAADSLEAGISKTKAGASALMVAKSAGQLENFLRSTQFVRQNLPELEEKFYNSVTSIGLDSPGDLGTYLYWGMSGQGIAGRQGFETHVRSFMNTAQFVAEKAPGAMQSFISAGDTLFSQSPGNIENFFGRVVGIASDFGTEATIRFSDLLKTAVRPELTDEFFGTSDAVKSLGKDLYSKFLTRMESDLEATNTFQAGTYLEYLTGLARGGDAKAVEQFLDTPISATFDESGNFTAGGITGTAVTGVDVLYGANAETFGSTKTSPYGFSTADTTQGENSVGVSLASNLGGQAVAVAGLSQTFDAQAGNHFTTAQTADITVQMNYNIGYSTWNPADLASTIYTIATAGAAGAAKVASEAAEAGVEVTAKQLLKGAVKEAVKETLKQVGKAVGNEVMEDQLAGAAGNNFEGEVTVMAYLVETNAQGESTVIAGKKVDSLAVDTNILGAPWSENKDRSNVSVTFEDVTVKPGYEYSVQLYVVGSVASVSGDVTKVTGEVGLDSIEVDFENDVDPNQTANVAAPGVPEHGTYTTQEVVKELARRRLEGAVGTIRDADMAQEAGNFQQMAILQQMSTYSLSMANQNPGTILSLLR